MTQMQSEKNSKEIKPLNIHQRMNAVMKAVKYIKKREKKNGMQYSYVAHDDVTREMHDALTEQGILPTTDVLSYENVGNAHKVHLLISFVNIDFPEDKISVNAWGYSIDNKEQGYGKALTYGIKYAYLKQFVLESGDEDEVDAYQQEEKKPPKAVSSGPVTPQQLLDLTKKIDGDKQAIEFILSRFDIKALGEIPKESFAKIMGWLETNAKEKANGKTRVA